MSVPQATVQIAFASQPDSTSPVWTDVTSYVLQTHGISLQRGRSDEFTQAQPGTCSLLLDNSDGRFTASPNGYVNSTNLVPNPLSDGTFTGYAAAAATLATDSGHALSGSSTVSVTATTAGTSNVYVLSPIPPASGAVLVTPGTTYRVTVKVLHVTGSARTYAALVHEYDSTNTIVRTGNAGAVTVTAGTWTELTWDWTASSTTKSIRVGVFKTGATAVGDQFNVAQVGVLTSGTTWFDGSTASSTDSAGFGLSYSWTGTAHASTSQQARTSPYWPNVKIGRKIRVYTGGSSTPSFTGYVDEWPVEWAPGALWAQALITASDRLKRLGQIAEFTNVVSEEIMQDDPVAYFPLGEPTGSTTAGDVSGSGYQTLTQQQVGSGGSITFGANTGPGTDGLPAPSFAPVNTTNGRCLSGQINNQLGGSAVSLRGSFSTTVAAAQTIVRAFNGQAGGFSGYSNLTLGTDATGKLTASLYDARTLTTYTATSTGAVNDGATHDAAVVLSSGTGVTMTLYLDGAQVAQVTATALPTVTALSIGGGASAGGNGALFTGTIAHVAAFQSSLPLARIQQHNTAVSTGFAGERSDSRIGRYARWAGIPTGEQSLETGLSTTIAFVDTTGVSPLAAMQDVTATENGLLYVDGSGVLTFQARSHRYNLTAPTLTIDAAAIDTSVTFKVNDQGLINDVTASRNGGITYRAQNASSISEYGAYRTSITLLTTSDPEVVSAATWRASNNATPAPRVANLTIDLLTNTSIAASIKGLHIGDWIELVNLPPQAPSSTVDLFIEGIQENVTDQQWSLSFNCSPAIQSQVWVLGVSQLGVDTILAY